jgi:hypothetical protein
VKLAALLLAPLLLVPQAGGPATREPVRATGVPDAERGDSGSFLGRWIERFDRHLAQPFHGRPGTPAPLAAGKVAPADSPVEILLFGGGTSHDFARWFGTEDSRTLAGRGRVRYTESPLEVVAALETLSVLVFSNNLPLPSAVFRQRIVAFVERGGGLVVLHAATWFNREDWLEWTQQMLAGGASSHEAYGAFEVHLEPLAHPLLAGVPTPFIVEDELYRLELDPDPGTTVLASGHSLAGSDVHPLLWTRTFGRGRVVGLTLGHDGGAHENSSYRRLLRNAVRWVAR